VSAPVFTEAELDAAVADDPEVSDVPDPEAPFGRRLDGQPKKSPGGRPAGKGGRRPGARPGGTRRGGTGPGVGAPPKRKATAPKSGSVDYREGLRGWLHIFSLPMLAYKPLQLDAAACWSTATTWSTRRTRRPKSGPRFARCAKS
jgi:hypothetical protein